jgi:hypothetical protein
MMRFSQTADLVIGIPRLPARRYNPMSSGQYRPQFRWCPWCRFWARRNRRPFPPQRPQVFTGAQQLLYAGRLPQPGQLIISIYSADPQQPNGSYVLSLGCIDDSADGVGDDSDGLGNDIDDDDNCVADVPGNGDLDDGPEDYDMNDGPDDDSRLSY